MQTHTTNYINTFIEIADDCPNASGEVPESRGNKKSVAQMQYGLIANCPYQLSSDDVFFQVFAERNDLTEAEYPAARAAFFSKGRPCFRASPLTQRYGFGVHSDHEGKVAIYGRETEEYEQFLRDPGIRKVKAMRTSKSK